jgi:membrane protein DedA with SNARE-associated domain
VEHFLDQYGYAAIFFIALVDAIAIPFPSEVTFGFTAALAAQGNYGSSLPGIIVAGVAGEILGCVVAYFIGRSGGRALIDRYGRFVLLSHADLDRADRFMEKRGAPAVFIGRFIPVVRAVISLVAGVGEMPAPGSPRPSTAWVSPLSATPWATTGTGSSRVSPRRASSPW